MIKQLNLSDNELLSLFKEGDQTAFKLIYERYWQLLYIAARKVLKDDEEAKDVVQEVFISFLNKAGELQINVAVSSYLYSAVKYKVFDCISRRKVRQDHLDSLDNYLSGGNPHTDQALLEKEINAEIEKEIQNLPEKMRAVFELSRKSELSHKEIADALKISDKTVKKQISNALKLLKPKFTNYYFLAFMLFSVALEAFKKLF